MKAIEYYEKYHETMLSKDAEVSNKAIAQFIVDLSCEVKKTYDARRGKSASALLGVIKEINQKGNAVMTLFEKKDGFAPLIHDAFLTYWTKESPELSFLVAASGRRF